MYLSTYFAPSLQEEKMRGILRTGQGVAFAFEPASGTLCSDERAKISPLIFIAIISNPSCISTRQTAEISGRVSWIYFYSASREM